MKQKKLTFPVLLMIVAMVASITMSNIFITEAATGTLSKNTGSRHTVATSLSTKAEIYYTGNYAYSALSQVPGGTSSCLETVNSSLYEKLHTLMADTMTKSFSYTSLTTYWPNTDASDGSENASMIYSDSTSSSSYSREHVWPKSRASFKETDGGSDIQHLRPENSAINSTRSNYTFGNVRGVLSDYSTKTYEEKDVLYYSPSNDIVEVNDNVKGDIARILLYVYVRWEEPNLFMDTPNPVIGENDDQNDGTKVIESLDTLLEWCQIDPVDTWEMSRNDQCENLQGNRNVFIDYPEYAWLLFGKTVPEDLVTPSGDNKDSLSASYTQITSADEFSEGGSYVLVAANEGNYYALGNTIGTKIDSVVVSVADNTVTAESLPVWQIAATQNGVSLSNGTGFLSYGSTTDFKSSTESYE
ncbi:MAG: endonuclease I family protein, partial [Ruminococcus sp.]